MAKTFSLCNLLKLDFGQDKIRWEKWLRLIEKENHAILALAWYLDESDRDVVVSMEDNGNMFITWAGTVVEYQSHEIWKFMTRAYSNLKAGTSEDVMGAFVLGFDDMEDPIPGWQEPILHYHDKPKKNGQAKLMTDTLEFVLSTSESEEVNLLVFGASGDTLLSGTNLVGVAQGLTMLGKYGTILGVDELGKNKDLICGNFKISFRSVWVDNVWSVRSDGKSRRIPVFSDKEGIYRAVVSDLDSYFVKIHGKIKEISRDETYYENGEVWHVDPGSVCVVESVKQNVKLYYKFSHVYCDLYLPETNSWAVLQHKILINCARSGSVSVKIPNVTFPVLCASETCVCKTLLIVKQPFVGKEKRGRTEGLRQYARPCANGLLCSCSNCIMLSRVTPVLGNNNMHLLLHFCGVRPCMDPGTQFSLTTMFFRSRYAIGCVLHADDEENPLEIAENRAKSDVRVAIKDIDFVRLGKIGWVLCRNLLNFTRKPKRSFELVRRHYEPGKLGALTMSKSVLDFTDWDEMLMTLVEEEDKSFEDIGNYVVSYETSSEDDCPL